MDTNYIIETKNLTKQYGSQKSVADLNIHVKRGRIYGLLGRNGAGKTTTMKMLLGLTKPTSGEVKIWGKSLQGNEKKLLPRIGSLIESPGFYPNLTGTENLRIFATLRGVPNNHAIKDALDLVGLPYKDKKLFSQYSLGMKQRLAIALAVMHDPELLILDEPINGLDPIGIAEVRSFIRELCDARGKTILISLESAAGDFRMMNAVDRREMLGPFYIIRIAGIVAFFVFLFVLAPFLIGFLNKSIFFPIHRMEQGISRVEKGDLEVRIENKKSSRELSHLIDSFNSMVEQIKTLKIQSYEDELEKQDLQLNYLQLQIEPHFYLNALNLINTMAQMGDCAMIRELTENLSLYLRYIVSTRSGCTTIRQEMDHIGHYLKIMEIRFGDSFQYMEEIDERVMDKKIPPLLIQMLVENSMKYAFDIYGNTQIRLKVSQECQDVVIVVEDNGSGYPKEILNCFEGGIQPEGNQIGLWNIRMRLEHMYRNRTSFQISNIEPQGARTEIRIKGEVE